MLIFSTLSWEAANSSWDFKANNLSAVSIATNITTRTITTVSVFQLLEVLWSFLYGLNRVFKPLLVNTVGKLVALWTLQQFIYKYLGDKISYFRWEKFKKFRQQLYSSVELFQWMIISLSSLFWPLTYLPLLSKLF